MGVKSTQVLTREQAEAKFFELYVATNQRMITAFAAAYSNSELANLLEEMDDKRAGGESFNNYQIEG